LEKEKLDEIEEMNEEHHKNLYNLNTRHNEEITKMRKKLEANSQRYVMKNI